MQRQRYLAILHRFRVIVVVIPVITALVSLLLALTQPPRYSATARLMVSQSPHLPEEVIPYPDVNLANSWKSTEYILDDIPHVIRSSIFAQDVSQWLNTQGYQVDAARVQAGLQAETFHRMVTITSNSDNPDIATKMVEGAVVSLQTHGLAYWNRAPETASTPDGQSNNGLRVALLDPASPAVSIYGIQWVTTQVGLRTALACGVAIGVAFLLHYLDDRLRSPQQAEEWMGVQVLGTIPEDSRGI